jgi:TRAP-type C4-dicarboxylate transport system substrate-binding protein
MEDDDMKRKVFWTLLVVAGALALPSLARVSAAGNTTIKLACLAPAGSSWDKVFRAWSNSLSKETGGALSFQIYPGGQKGDERDVIRRMKLGEIDAGAMTSIGLGQIARPTYVLQMPGIIQSYKELNYVREKLAPEFNAMFEKEGYTLLGWGDAGFLRQFSKKPILKPEDLKTVRPWVPRDDPTLPEMMKIIGANGVPLGIPEVFPALQTGMVDTVVVSAIAAVALQWFRYVTHMSKEAPVAILAATVLRSDLYKALPPDHQKKLMETSKKAHAAMMENVQKEDLAAFKTLTGRGIQVYEAQGTPEQKKAWDALNAELIKRMTGRLWSKELLEKVLAVAKTAPK